MHTKPIKGAGLGLRRELLSSLLDGLPDTLSFLEIAPENWMAVGGKLGAQLRNLTGQHAFTAHGLSLSIGGPAPLDIDFLRQLKVFLDTHQIALYTEHLSYCSDHGHFYDLYPLPFTGEAVRHVAKRCLLYTSPSPRD